jgi:hypothetical protein
VTCVSMTTGVSYSLNSLVPALDAYDSPLPLIWLSATDPDRLQVTDCPHSTCPAERVSGRAHALLGVGTHGNATSCRNAAPHSLSLCSLKSGRLQIGQLTYVVTRAGRCRRCWS